MQLSRFPRIHLAHLPTPLEHLPRLTKALGGPEIYIKRDDCTGLAFGGNKARKLEFLLGEALAQKADTLITAGAVQSNHARQTAAAAAKCGLRCILVLSPSRAKGYTGNILLNDLMGAQARLVPDGADLAAEMERVAREVADAGGKPYIVPVGGSTPTGALGYVNFMMELVAQANEQGVGVDYLVMPSGSAGTQAGMVVGAELLRSGILVVGITVSRAKAQVEERVMALAEKTLAHMGIKAAIARDRVVAYDQYYGEAYGVPTPGMIEAVKMLAATEGIILDPVYTGKAMAGLIDLVRRGRFKKGETVVFAHTGGTPALFAYSDTFKPPQG
jgi:L-cysteate sulfo-lyase